MKNIQKHSDPSPEEIRDKCREIRKEWSESAWLQRSFHRKQAWTVPEIQAVLADKYLHLHD